MSAIKQHVPDGFRQSEIGIFPTDWKINSLAEISTKITDGTHDTPKPIKEGIPFLTAIHVKENHIAFESCYFLPKSVHDEIYKRCNPEYEDILMVNIGAGTGTTALVNVKYPFSLKNVALIKPDKKVSDGRFLNQVLSFLKDEILESLSAGGAQPFLSLSQIGQINAPIPSKEEQTAIANALSDVDALLTELENLIAKKQAIKTATMQQLLTGKTRLPQFATYTEGENQGAPKGKSKGTKPSELGEIPEDWDVSTIADISLVPMQNGLFYEPARKGKGVPLINVSDMYTSAPISVESLELFNASKTELKAFKVNEGDLFFTRSSIVPSGIAFCNVLPKSDKEVVFDSHLIRVRVNPKIADYNYVHLNCLAKHSRLHLIANSKTATMTTIDQKAINCCPVLLPCKEEQSAIATILSDMDNEIQTLEQRLAKTRQIKQGMMQQLLTGRTRLPY